MLILLPPSEGKTAPRRGARFDLAALSFPGLTEARAEIMEALVGLCSGSPAEAAAVLGLGPTQAGEVARNALLAQAPTARADRVYTGVLYEALDLAGLSTAAKRRAASRLATVSALFGLVRPADRIPAYRLSGQVTLPGLGPVGRFWGHRLPEVVVGAAGPGLIVDLRSSAYAPFWKPAREQAPRTVTVRVLNETDGRRTVVSHFNKATKGRLVRDLLEEGSAPRLPAELAELLTGLGWHVEPEERAGRPPRLDVVVGAL